MAKGKVVQEARGEGLHYFSTSRAYISPEKREREREEKRASKADLLQPRNPRLSRCTRAMAWEIFGDEGIHFRGENASLSRWNVLLNSSRGH